MLRHIRAILFLLIVLANVATFPHAAEAVMRETDELAVVARQEEAFGLPADQRPEGWAVLRAGDLGAIFDCKQDGIELLSLFDLAKHRQLLAEKPIPFFKASFRHVDGKQGYTLSADSGWRKVSAEKMPDGNVAFVWQEPKNERLGKLRVTAVAALDTEAEAIRWKYKIDNVDKQWCVRWVTVPQLALDSSAPRFTSFHPLGPGRIKQGAVERNDGGSLSFRFSHHAIHGRIRSAVRIRPIRRHSRSALCEKGSLSH